MIKNKINTIWKAGLMGAVILTACPSCSDTWDDHYDVAEGFQSTATSTLWEQVQANGKLSQFAQILAKTPYYTDERHPAANYTFKDMLNSTQILTVWAPEDGTYDAEEWLAKCETDGYSVQQQFLGNHIALWRKAVSGTSVDSVTLLNSKRIIFDKAQGLFCENAVLDANIPAKNGVLHTLNGAVPFQYNLYEYIKSDERLSLLKAYITSKDTTYFSAGASTEGPSDENGNPTYVDSVYYTYNLLFNSYYYAPANSEWLTYLEGLNAQLDVEDSAYAMIVPTDQAWQAARERLAPYYNYATAYINKTEKSNGVDEELKLNADSLRELCLDMDLTSPTVFNIRRQPREGVGILSKETFDANKGALTYLLNTRSDTLRNTPEWSIPELFDGVEPVEMSNGLCYVVNNWNFPASFYKPDVEIECSYFTVFNPTSLEGKTNVTSLAFDNLAGDWVLETGKVSNDNYLVLEGASNTTQPSAEFKIVDNVINGREIMSGKYDVYVVMVPYYYRMGEDCRVEEPDMVLKNRFRATITYSDGSVHPTTGKVVEKTKQTSTMEYDGQKVDTLLLFEDFQFPVSYKNLRDCYPTIMLKDAATASNLRNGYTHTLAVDRFLFVSKED